MTTSCDSVRPTVLEPPTSSQPDSLVPSSRRSETSAPRVAILGVPFDHLTMAQTIERIEQMIASRRPHYVVTANVDFLVQARQDVELRRILVEADLVLCDGTPLVWASRLLGNPLPGRVAGADLVPRLIQQAAERNYRIFFLGGAPEVSARAVLNLQNQYPRLKIVGSYSPSFVPLLEMDHAEMCRRIREARPDLLFVAFGCPKAEKWMAMHYRGLGVPVLIGVGGTIDFLAGRLQRAPVWMQHGGVEWIWRLLQEPRRLVGRYLADLRHFGIALLRQWWRLHTRPRSLSTADHSASVRVESTWQRVRVPAWLDAAAVRRDQLFWDQEIRRHCLLELDQVRFIDSTGVGLLVGLQKRLHATGHTLVLLAPSRSVRRALRLMRLEDFFRVATDAAQASQVIREQGVEMNLPPDLNVALSQPLLWQGEITAANADQVWQHTRTWIRAARCRSVPLVIDLAAVRFIDCSGLGVMVRAKKLAAQQQVWLRFAGAQANVRNVLRWARLETALLDSSP
ncbi:MAG: WecB/TagA/CpsF family glycosyltransferase [Verrucomicrobia bacterium]|nr:WecB/TagA/CpsF family glycosyltransferase [Verrucomicrobiota bacterium]